MKSNTDTSNNSRHKWSIDDVCVKCGIGRRGIAVSKNMLRYSTGSFIGYEYFINDIWTSKRPCCNDVKQKKRSLCHVKRKFIYSFQ